MNGLETRWPCPVCLGVKLEKLAVGDELVLDDCPRCGGMWFEVGEIQKLRGARPHALWDRVDAGADAHRARCHSCRSFVERDADRCPICDAKNRLDCPRCAETMKRIAHDELVVDVCRRCDGVWFDRHELDAIWTLERDRLVAKYREQGKVAKVARDGSEVLLETLVWAPDLVVYGAIAAGKVASAALEAAPGILEVLGEAAASVFETLVEIIAGVFG